MKTLLTGVIAALTMLLAPHAGATPETDFLDALDNQGVTYDDPKDVLQVGNLVCQRLTAGGKYSQSIQDFATANNVTWDAASAFHTQAVIRLCPWHEQTIIAQGLASVQN